MERKKLEEVFQKCIQYADTIINPTLKICCKEILNDYKEEYMNKPATADSTRYEEVGEGLHHYERGGLLYHSYCVTRNAIAICDMYPDLAVDRDLVLFGALLHDIGKAEDYTDWEEDEKRETKSLCNNSRYLLGHSYEGTHIVQNYLERYQLPIEFRDQVLHMIGSHMFECEPDGVLAPPKMLEVVIINYGDSMDAYLQPAYEVIREAKPGELYQISNAPRSYFKSLNPYQNKHNKDNEKC